MGFKYIDGLATPQNVEKFLSLVDKVAGSKFDTQNVFDIDDLLIDSPQMQKGTSKNHVLAVPLGT